MEKKTFNKLDLDVYEETLDCGLRIFICPLDRHEIIAKITTHYGSGIIEFKPESKKEFIKIPLGTAHFLEHKMFAKKDGRDIMNIFQKNGASSNAYTSTNVTSYYFSSPNKFMENLEQLLDLVTQPYYTKENVQKEMGIIDQEIKAGFDNPYEASYYTTMLNLFKESPYRYPVAGYTESIKEITPEILYDCHNTFYHPSNMTLTITGNVRPEETIKFIKEYYGKLDYKNIPHIEKKQYNEPKEVSKEEEIIYKDITHNIIENAYKINIKDINIDKQKFINYIDTYLTIKFGSISKFNKTNYEDKNILNPIRYTCDIKDDYMIIDFDTEVIEVKDIFQKIYDNINDKNFTKEDFELIKKNTIKDIILLSESTTKVNNAIDYQVRFYGKVLYDIYDVFKTLTYEECKKIIDGIDFTNNTRTIVTKKPE